MITSAFPHNKTRRITKKIFQNFQKFSDMWSKNFLKCLLLLSYFLISIHSERPKNQVEQEIINSSLKNYDKNMRPSQQVNVVGKIKPKQIVDIDENKQIMTLNLEMELVWRDTRLGWNKSQFENIEHVFIPAKNLWKPDVYFLNTADTRGFFPERDDNFIAVAHDSNCFFTLPIQNLKTICKSTSRNVPFDSINCSLIITSWSHTSDKLTFAINVDIDRSELVQNDEWDLVGCSRNLFYSRPRFSVQRFGFGNTDYMCKLKRKPRKFMLTYILPFFLLNLLSLSAFMMPFPTQLILGELF